MRRVKDTLSSGALADVVKKLGGQGRTGQGEVGQDGTGYGRVGYSKVV